MGRWWVYALGGGLGHLTRAVALGREAARRGHAVEVVTNSPFAPHLSLETYLGESARVHRLGAHLGREAASHAVARLLREARPEVVLVDTFPRGLGGELVELLEEVQAPKVLVHRDLRPEYVERFGLAQAVEGYALLLLPGEPAPFEKHPRAVRTEPWLLLEAEELLEATEARRQLGVEGEEVPVVAVLACGRPEEVAEQAALAETLGRGLAGRAAVRLLSPCPVPEAPEALRPWPALRLWRGVEVLVGAGGYNTVQEARATGTPLVALARPRLYDRQGLRLRPEERADTPREVVERVEALVRWGRHERPAPLYVNGVHAAVAAVEALGR